MHMDKIAKMISLYRRLTRVEDCDWYCDNCGECLNDQPGFTYDCGTWTCTCCGYENYIDEDNIIDEDSPRGYCNICEHSSDFPDCKERCPYEFF